MRGKDELGDLDRVERRALAQVVAGEEEHEAVLRRLIGADATDVHLVRPDGVPVCRNRLDPKAGRPAQEPLGIGGRERRLRLDPHRLRVTHDDGHPHARRAHREIGELEDLARLLAELDLLVVLDAVELPVHPEAVVVGLLAAERVDRRGAGTRDGLVGRDADAPQPRGISQRREHHRERDRAAVGIRDDSRRARALARR